MPDAPEHKVRARLGSFGFSADKADRAVETLSGGEKTRLMLAICTFNAPELLVLDEPTNHLDIDSREALIHALNEYEGAVLMISHDPHLVEACADQLWLVAGGIIRPWEDDLDAYRRYVITGKIETPQAAKPNINKAEARKLAAQRREQMKPLRQKIQALEKDVERLSKERDRLDAALADPATKDPTETAKSRAATLRALAAAEEQWLAATEEYEAGQREAEDA
jgi:ATP-binding cassette subfamily F protein 3